MNTKYKIVSDILLDNVSASITGYETLAGTSPPEEFKTKKKKLKYKIMKNYKLRKDNFK